VIEDVREFEIEGFVIERLVVKIALDYERRRRYEVDSDGISHADLTERGDFLADAGADAEAVRRVRKEAGGFKRGEEGGEHADFAVPVARSPDAAEFRV